MADADVAGVAQDSAHCSRFVVVVDVPCTVSAWLCAGADSALPALDGKQGVELFYCDPKISPKLPISDLALDLWTI